MTEVAAFNRYAIFQSGGKQYQGIEGKTVALDRLKGKVGETVEFSDVFFRKLDETTMEVGQPTLAGAVKASIVKHLRGPKITVFHFKRRKKSRVKKGHRSELTVVRIDSLV